MRVERVQRWPIVPWWAVTLVGAYLAMVSVWTWAGSDRQDHRPALCIFRQVTGQPCPTCGTTRLIIAAAKGQFGKAAAYNPLVFALALLGLVLLILRVGFRRRLVWITSAFSRRLVAATLVFAVLANWLYLLFVF